MTELVLHVKEQKGDFVTDITVPSTITTLELKILLEQQCKIPAAEMRYLSCHNVNFVEFWQEESS
jgi:hypothetical protein